MAAANGTIAIRGLRVFAHHGVLSEEREQGQEFVIDVSLHLDLEEAMAGDRLVDTIDYAALAAAIHDRVAGERWDLIERVAARVADLVLEDSRVRSVEVAVHKPQALIAVPFDDVIVTVRR